MSDCALMSLKDRPSSSVHFMLTCESLVPVTGTGPLPLSSMESHLLPISLVGTPPSNHLFLSSNRFACSRSQPSPSSLGPVGRSPLPEPPAPVPSGSARCGSVAGSQPEPWQVKLAGGWHGDSLP